MFFGPADETIEVDHFAVVSSDSAAITAKHLMHFAGDEQQIRLGHALDERREFQIEATVWRGHLPRLLEVLRTVLEIDLLKFVNAAIEDQRVLGGLRRIAETKAQIQPDGAAIGQEARRAGPHPERAIIPDAAPPIEIAQRVGRLEVETLTAPRDVAFRRQAVDLAVVVEAAGHCSSGSRSSSIRDRM